MKILGHRHTGILTSDLDRMIEFYIGLGFVLKHRDLEKGSFIEELLNSEGIILETAKLIIENDELPIKYQYVLELMSLNHDSSNFKGKSLKKKQCFEFTKREIGILDIAFTVDDINAVRQYVLAQGGDLIAEPLRSIAGYPALHCYMRDPEGNVLHIAENV